METYYTRRYYTETDYFCVEHTVFGERVVDIHNEQEWMALGNVPEKESGDRFISIVNGEVILDPNKDAILQQESDSAAAVALAEKEKNAKAARILQEIIDNLPSWKEVKDAIDGATTIAQLKVIIKKMARIEYLLAKNEEE